MSIIDIVKKNREKISRKYSDIKDNWGVSVVGYPATKESIIEDFIASQLSLLEALKEELKEKFDDELKTWVDFTEKGNITEEERFFAKIKVGVLQDLIGRLLLSTLQNSIDEIKKIT